MKGRDGDDSVREIPAQHHLLAADDGTGALVERLNLTEEEPCLGQAKYDILMLSVICLSIVFVIPEVIVGVARHNSMLLLLGGLTFLITAVGSLSMALARLGRFKLGVYVWGLLSSCVIALIPLATSGLAGIEVECAVLNLLVIALFISPRNLKYFIMLLTGTVILAGLLDTFVPWPRLQMTGLLVAIPLGVHVGATIIIGTLIILLGEVLLKKLDTTKAYAGFLEKATEAELKYIATHDPLTQLPNRVLLGDRFHQMRARARRFSQHLAILLIDLDHFKDVNDQLGHGIGDLLLKEVSRRLERCVRECDSIVRMGGDEFIILLGELAAPENSLIVANRVLRAMETPFMLGSSEVRIGASIGVSSFPDDGDNLEDLLRSSDLALYSAKDKGRGRFMTFQAGMNTETLAKKDLSSALVNAVTKKELVLHYQPIVNVLSGRIIGLEALLRWQHPTMGLLQPLSFIPLAEETGLIVPIGEWVLATACSRMVAWQRRGIQPMSVSINLSPRQLYHRDLLSMFQKVLGETGMDPRFLELEITESSAMQNEADAASILSRLRDMGMKIIIDDFGSGYSSMQRLRSLPIDALKIDRYFIKNIVDDPSNAAIVMAIITLARHLNLQVIAEGVETMEQLEFLRSIKLQYSSELYCDQAQGFLFARPQTEDRTTEMLLSNPGLS